MKIIAAQSYSLSMPRATLPRRLTTAPPSTPRRPELGRLARLALRAGSGCATLAVGVLTALQLAAWPAQDPLAGTVSGMVFAPGGWLLMPMAGLLALVGVTAAWCAALVQRRAILGALLAIWALALGAATLFPTDPPGAQMISASGQIHRWAAATMFVTAPLAGWVYARRAPARLGERLRLVRVLSIATLTVAAVNLVIQLPKVAAGALADALRPALHYGGLTERVLLGLMFAQLIAMAWHAQRRWLLTGPAWQQAVRLTSGVLPVAGRVRPLAMGHAA